MLQTKYFEEDQAFNSNSPIIMYVLHFKQYTQKNQLAQITVFLFWFKIFQKMYGPFVCVDEVNQT